MTAKKKLGIASDHAGFELKEYIKKALPEFEWIDEGPLNTDRTDYPDYAKKLAEKIAAIQTQAIKDSAKSGYDQGVLICGSGIGMCIAANKLPGVRAAVVESEKTASLSKQHNNSNVLCIGARVLDPEYAKKVLLAWIKAEYEGGRHDARLNKIKMLEQNKKS